LSFVNSDITDTDTALGIKESTVLLIATFYEPITKVNVIIKKVSIVNTVFFYKNKFII